MLYNNALNSVIFSLMCVIPAQTKSHLKSFKWKRKFKNRICIIYCSWPAFLQTSFVCFSVAVIDPLGPMFFSIISVNIQKLNKNMFYYNALQGLIWFFP